MVVVSSMILFCGGGIQWIDMTFPMLLSPLMLLIFNGCTGRAMWENDRVPVLLVQIVYTCVAGSVSEVSFSFLSV